MKALAGLGLMINIFFTGLFGVLLFIVVLVDKNDAVKKEQAIERVKNEVVVLSTDTCSNSIEYYRELVYKTDSIDRYKKDLRIIKNELELKEDNGILIAILFFISLLLLASSLYCYTEEFE